MRKSALSVQQVMQDDSEIVKEALREYAAIRLQRTIVAIRRYCEPEDARRGVETAMRALELINQR